MEGADLRIVSADAAVTARALLDADTKLEALRIADATLEDAIATLLAPADERIAA
jgi:ABC-2 type transport system ATP-binding protein